MARRVFDTSNLSKEQESKANSFVFIYVNNNED